MTQPEQPAQQLPPIAPQPTQEQRPQAQQRPSLRPRSRSGFSFRSHKSQDSYGSTPKVEIQETPREKAARRLSTKADPRLAMSEAQPSDIANDHSTRLASLRAIQHRDTYGLPIADPDRSNPTRSRWERPLDTIRSFEAAIDGNYARKSGRYDGAIESRRSSYYGGTIKAMVMADEASLTGTMGMQMAMGPGPTAITTTTITPALNTMAGVYPPNGNAQSYETVTTAAGSGSSAEPLGYSTDPSSDNSSFDRVAPISKADYGNNSPSNGQYGYQSNQQQYPVGGVQQGHQAAGYPSQKNGPLPPVKDREPPRVPIKLGKSAPGAPTQQYDPPKAAPDKPKSWFSKRFSKS
ncbi:hypothetical protein VC83_05050 [Pseudogymnoascus destructans]|uniref:DUF2406 domain-containing protein n=1 Tax=Pseudogymnoascus destructans TaxID=655981 RepID=A0A177A9P5_9PEZI|nr:uncharacterized protein VC83_05050 [Pseudogymnoascus destructans]OAF58470.1 hypothetical protein VC83_05050 [Pseudogymnoascus destructans]